MLYILTIVAYLDDCIEEDYRCDMLQKPFLVTLYFIFCILHLYFINYILLDFYTFLCGKILLAMLKYNKT